MMSATDTSSEIATSKPSSGESPSPSSNGKVPRISQKRPRMSVATGWIWEYFNVTEVHRRWEVRKTKRIETIDRDIRCSLTDKRTGEPCPYATSDSKRQTSTTNMQRHLADKHSIFSPHAKPPESPFSQPAIADFVSKGHMTHQERLEQNPIKWVVKDNRRSWSSSPLSSNKYSRIFLA